MLELIGNPDLRARLATNALKFVADKGWETKKSEYLELVDRLAEPPTDAKLCQDRIRLLN